VKWDFRDNGASYWDLHGEHLITLCQSYDAGSGNAHTKTFSFDWEPLTLGQHVLTMRGAVQLEVSVNGNWTWYDGGSVTVCVRNDPADPVPGVPMGVPGSCNPPPTATSQINAFPTFTLSPVPVRVLPTHTPAPPAPPLPSSGDACSQFTSQDNCNLAGCSWSGSACTVTQ
jgi:hypothetical protein